MKLSLSDLRPVPIAEIGVTKPRAEKAPAPRRYSSPEKSRRPTPQGRDSTVSYRKIFLGLLGTAAAVAYMTNQYQVRTEATIMARHLEAQLKSVAASGTIHSNTVSYEQEVNRVTEKN